MPMPSSFQRPDLIFPPLQRPDRPSSHPSCGHKLSVEREKKKKNIFGINEEVEDKLLIIKLKFLVGSFRIPKKKKKRTLFLLLINKKIFKKSNSTVHR